MMLTRRGLTDGRKQMVGKCQQLMVTACKQSVTAAEAANAKHRLKRNRAAQQRNMHRKRAGVASEFLMVCSSNSSAMRSTANSDSTQPPNFPRKPRA